MAKEGFVERMAAALGAAGFPRQPARVFSALLVDDDGRMTSSELTDALTISAASVSGAVRYLEQVGMVRREREPGGRRDVYVVDEDTWQGALRSSTRVYAPLLAAMDAGVELLGPAHPARARLVLTREFLRFVTAEMEALSVRWEARRRELLTELEG